MEQTLARVKTTPPKISREKGQRSLDIPLFLRRRLPAWVNPRWWEGEQWRAIVQQQPVAVVCRETLISNMIALEWKIESRDSEQRDELKSEIDFHTRFLESDGTHDFTERLEWLIADTLDIPFGGAYETIREGDQPKGKVLRLVPIDGATLFPTRNVQFPVGQFVGSASQKPVFFPAHAINRIYYSPRRQIDLEGWGMPPPEQIFLAINLLNRGDQYYANLLLDTPEAGILDLGDMETAAAKEWVESWKEMLVGVDPFKVPVLYEHTTKAEFISFSRSPTEIMFDKATLKYAALTCAAYGMSLSDIGIQVTAGGGETLAGSIRQERRSRKTGIGKLKTKLKLWYDRILPESLEFKWIDLDDELAVSKGRGRLASITAFNQAIERGIFTPNEARAQLVADGLIDISISETIEGGDEVQTQEDPADKRPGMLGNSVPPSSGGTGEVRQSVLSTALHKILSVEDIRLRRIIRSVLPAVLSETRRTVNQFDDIDTHIDLLQEWNKWHDEVLWGNLLEEIPELTSKTLKGARTSLDTAMKNDASWDLELDTVSWTEELQKWFNSIRNETLARKSELEYERGTSEKLETAFLEDKELTKQFEKEIKSLAQNIQKNMPVLIKNSTISGVRNYLSSKIGANKIAETLDIELFMRDNVIEFVRQELFDTLDNLETEIGNSISNTINKLLEDVE